MKRNCKLILCYKKRAKNQIRFNRILKTALWIWYISYFIAIGFFVFQIAVTNSENKISFYLFFKIFLYILLFLIEETAVLRSQLVFAQLDLSCLYLGNHLYSLTDRIEKFLSLDKKNFDRLALTLLKEYDIILGKQRKLNSNFEKNFYAYFCYISFTLSYPFLLLSQNTSYPNERLLYLYNLITYLTLYFLVFLPPILFNTFFTNSNMYFVRRFFFLCKHLKTLNCKLKVENLIFTINQTPQSVSFNFRNFMNYSLSLFIFWVLESLSISLLTYAAVNFNCNDCSKVK